MKRISYLLAIILCVSLSCHAGIFGKLFKTISGVANQVVQSAPTNVVNQTKKDCWEQGIGGKALVIAGAAIGTYEQISGKDKSRLKDALNNSMQNVANNGYAQPNNAVSSVIGAAIGSVGELQNVYNKDRFDKEVDYWMSDPDRAMQVKDIDYEKNRIIFKSPAEIAREKAEYGYNNQNQYLENNIEQKTGLTLSQYNALTGEDRQKADLRLIGELPPVNSKEDEPIKPAEPVKPAEPAKPDYKSLITKVVVSQYALNSSRLSDGQSAQLKEVITYMNADENINIIIVGHTCSIGSNKANEHVGLKRAEAAKRYLVENGVVESRISTESVGSSQPVSSNDTETGRMENRRITFKIAE